MSTLAPAPSLAERFSLVRGDAPYRLQRRAGLVPTHGLGLVRRAAFWTLLAWLPLAVWAALMRRALPGEMAEPLLAHFGVHARLLFAVPLLILAEAMLDKPLGRLLAQFERSGLVVAAEQAHFDAALRAVERLRDATLPWFVILGLSFAMAWAADLSDRAHELQWAADAAQPSSLGFGGLWYLWVGRPLFLVLVLGWLWRLALLGVLLLRLSRLNLALVPTHADRCAGLGFLEKLPMCFAPLALGVGAVLASRWAHDAVYHGLALVDLKLQMLIFVVICVLVLCLPLLALMDPLKRAKKQALPQYSALVARQGRLVHQRWIEGREVDDAPILSAPELGPVADTAEVYRLVQGMRTSLLGKAAIVPVALAAALPMVAVLTLQLPVKQLLQALLKALV